MRPKVVLVSAWVIALTGCGVTQSQVSPQDVFLNFIPMNQTNSHTYTMQYIVTEFVNNLDSAQLDPSQVNGMLNISEDKNDGSYKVDWRVGKHDFQFIMSHDGVNLTEYSLDAQALSIPDFGIMATSDSDLYNNWHH